MWPQCLAIFGHKYLATNVWPQIVGHTYLATMHFAAESQAAFFVIIPRPTAGVELLFNQVLNRSIVKYSVILSLV